MRERQKVQQSLQPDDYPFTHRLRTRFAETDAMGVIHHGAYLLYLEEARVELLRHIGHPYDEVRRARQNFAVIEAAVHYRLPLEFDEEVVVHVRVGAVRRATFQLDYLLTVETTVRTTAVTVHGCVDEGGRAVRLPSWVAETFSSAASAGSVS